MLNGCVHCVTVSACNLAGWYGSFAFFHATFGLFALMKLGWKKKGLLGMRRWERH